MSDCLIIGGGIIGMLTALELAQAGFKVSIVERGKIGQEASWAGGGILSPLYPWRHPTAVTTLSQWSQTHYPEFFNQILQTTDIDPEYVGNGLLILDTEEYTQAKAWAEQYQIPLQLLSGENIYDCEPELGQFKEAFWLPMISQVRNPRLMKALRKALELADIALLEHYQVTALEVLGQKNIGIHTENHGFLAAKHVVIAAGAWSGRLLNTINIPLDISPVRGQMILFSAQPGLMSRIILSNEHYIIPRRDGCILAGSTLEQTGFKKETTERALQNLKYSAITFVPRLADYRITHHWAGLRPSSPNGIPYICQHPNIEGLYINTGHFRNGVVLGLASARLMGDIILERSPILDPEPYKLPG